MRAPGTQKNQRDFAASPLGERHGSAIQKQKGKIIQNRVRRQAQAAGIDSFPNDPLIHEPALQRVQAQHQAAVLKDQVVTEPSATAGYCGHEDRQNRHAWAQQPSSLRWWKLLVVLIAVNCV